MSTSRPDSLLVIARWPVGGIRTHLGYNHSAIRAAGWRSTLVVPDDDSLAPLKTTLEGADFVPTSHSRLWRAAWPLVRRHRLVHAHGMTAAAHAALATIGSGVPLVVTLHEPLRDPQFRGVAGWVKRRLLALALGRASAVVTVSQDARDNLIGYFPGLDRGRLHVIPNGIDAARYADAAPTGTLRQELNLRPGTVLVGYLGRFMPEKGFPLLLDAVARLAAHGPGRPFHVVAFGSSDYRREYQKRIEGSGLSALVTLRDFVPDVRPVLGQLDLVAVPSLWEASSLVSMEAMCAGVPVLGSDCPGLREVLRGTPSRTVPAADGAALEGGLRDALNGPWTAAARAYAAAARQRFDVRRSAARLVDLYASLTEARR